MKMYYKLLLMALFPVLFLGACSSGGDEIPEPGPTPTPNADKVTISSKSMTVDVAGTTATLSFSTNKAWTATSDQSWCTLNPTSGQAGNASITLTVAANSTNQIRSATITITAGTATAKSTIQQNRKEVEGEGNIEDMENKKW